MATAKKTKQVQVTLVKSLIGRKKSHIATANSMGLRKMGDVSLQPDNDATRGKITHICYLVDVKEI